MKEDSLTLFRVLPATGLDHASTEITGGSGAHPLSLRSAPIQSMLETRHRPPPRSRRRPPHEG